MASLGFLQYVGPTCQFLLAVFVFKERFEPMQQISFALIWIALLVFTVDSVRALSARRMPADAAAPEAPAPVDV